MNKTSLSEKIVSLPWWVWVGGIDLLLVLATVTRKSLIHIVTLRRVLRPFDLGREMNLAAWWSSILLLALGLICYELYCTKNDRTRNAWLLLSVALTILSLDEIGSVHERIEDWIPWVDPYIPMVLTGMFLIPYPLLVLFRNKQTRRTATFLLSGFLLFGSIAIQERLEGYVDWGRWRGVRLGVEEGTELLGMFLCYWGVVSQRRQFQHTKNLSCAVPNPFLMRHLSTIALVLLGFHLAATGFVAAFIDVEYSGRTIMWYPVVISFLLFAAAFWKFVGSHHLDWLLLASFFLACSASVPYLIFPHIFDPVDALIDANFYLLYVAQLVLIVGFYLKVFRTLSTSAWLLLGLLVLSLELGFSIDHVIARYAFSGVFAYFMFRLFWLNMRSDHDHISERTAT